MRNQPHAPLDGVIHRYRPSFTSLNVVMRCLAVLVVVAALLPLAPTTSRAAGEFSDVPFTHTFHEDISWLATRGITKGCNPPANDRFCPDEPVSRGEMAAFLSRALNYSDRLNDPFVDDDGSTFEPDIERLAAAGVTKGCNPPSNNRFCPGDVVTRGQMAAFLHRAIEPSGSGRPSPRSTGFVGAGLTEANLTPSGSITSSRDGQVIESKDVVGRVVIRHDNVTVRNSRIQYTANYGVFVEKVNGVCPRGTVIEYVEIDGSQVPDNYAPAYDSSCGFVIDKVHMHHAGTGIRTYGDSVIVDSYLVNDKGGSGAHREPVLLRGSNHLVRNNVLICDVPSAGCSAAIAIYGDPYPTTNILVEGNLLAATAAYCVYGGATHTYADQATNVDIVNNAFSVALTPETPNKCGRAGNITAHRDGVDGNERYGNYIYETGKPFD